MNSRTRSIDVSWSDTPKRDEIECNHGSPSDARSIGNSRNRPGKVHFHSQVTCRRFNTCSNLIREDFWYSEREMREHKRRDSHLQNLLERSERSLWGDDDTVCLPLYGIRTTDEKKSRKRLISDARAAVFAQQSFEKPLLLSVFDNNDSLEESIRLSEERIARAYSSHSRKAALVSYFHAVQSKRNVDELWNEESESESDSLHSTKSHSTSTSNPSCRSKMLGSSAVPKRNDSIRSQPSYCVTSLRSRA